MKVPWNLVFSQLEQLDENDFCHCYSNFYSKMSFQKYLITGMFKVLSQQLRGNLTRYLKNILQSKILRTWIDIGVKHVPRHFTYYCMLLFLSNKLNLCI